MAGQRAEARGHADLAGVLPVFQTPFDDRDRIDYPALEKLFDWVFANGADGVVFAMVSEILRMSSQERDEVAAAACRLSRGRGRCVSGRVRCRPLPSAAARLAQLHRAFIHPSRRPGRSA